MLSDEQKENERLHRQNTVLLREKLKAESEAKEWFNACAERDKRIAELERQLEEARKQMEVQKEEWLAWEAKRKALEKDAERWAHACKGSNKQINVCSWDNDAYEFVGYAMKKDAIDAIADAEIAAMKGTP